MSLKDKEGKTPVRNSTSEDTVYTQLIKEKSNGSKAIDVNRRTNNHDNLATNQINSSTDSNEISLNNSNESNQMSSLSTDKSDKTDKQVVMTRFVNSPLKTKDTEHEYVSDYISEEEREYEQPPAKKGRQEGRRKLTVEEYTKRKQREAQIEEERCRKDQRRVQKEKEREDRNSKARHRRKQLTKEDKIPKASIQNPKGESERDSLLPNAGSVSFGDENDLRRVIARRRAKKVKAQQSQESQEEYESSEDSDDMPNKGVKVHKQDDDSDSDDDYHLFAHVETQIVEKIQEGKFVELPRLFPNKNKLEFDDDDDEGFATITKQGRLYLNKSSIPTQEKDLPIINSFARWQIAFRIYAAIYERKYPEKGVELWQYEHSIQKAASKFYWDNVATYDKLFRKRIARHHLKAGYPKKSWAIKHQSAWDLELMDRLPTHDVSANGLIFPPNPNLSSDRRNSFSSMASPGAFKNKRFCGLLNKLGKCKYGNKCKFEHRCYFCGKKGHGIANCRAIKEGVSTNGLNNLSPKSNNINANQN